MTNIMQGVRHVPDIWLNVATEPIHKRMVYLVGQEFTTKQEDIQEAQRLKLKYLAFHEGGSVFLVSDESRVCYYSECLED